MKTFKFYSQEDFEKTMDGKVFAIFGMNNEYLCDVHEAEFIKMSDLGIIDPDIAMITNDAYSTIVLENRCEIIIASKGKESERLDAIEYGDSDDTIEIMLDKRKYPLAYHRKVKELMISGLSREDAERFVDTTPFVMELLYDTDNGLFLVESEALGSIGDVMCSPYSEKQLIYVPDED